MRRNEAVEAVRMYCDVLEGGPRRGRRYAKQPTTAKNDATVGSDSDYSPPCAVTRAPFVSAEERILEAETSTRADTKPLVCFQCYGMKHYSRHKHLLRHLRNTHLNDRYCNQCNKAVEYKMSLRRHLQDSHGLKT